MHIDANCIFLFFLVFPPLLVSESLSEGSALPLQRIQVLSGLQSAKKCPNSQVLDLGHFWDTEFYLYKCGIHEDPGVNGRQ